MRTQLERQVFMVARAGSGWCVQHDGDVFGHSPDKEIAKAAAARRAREMQDSGQPCQVLVHGEQSFRGG